MHIQYIVCAYKRKLSLSLSAIFFFLSPLFLFFYHVRRIQKNSTQKLIELLGPMMKHLLNRFPLLAIFLFFPFIHLHLHLRLSFFFVLIYSFSLSWRGERASIDFLASQFFSLHQHRHRGNWLIPLHAERWTFSLFFSLFPRNTIEIWVKILILRQDKFYVITLERERW